VYQLLEQADRLLHNAAVDLVIECHERTKDHLLFWISIKKNCSYSLFSCLLPVSPLLGYNLQNAIVKSGLSVSSCFRALS
jgi:hypothetical protein